MIERVKEEGDDDEDIAESAGNALEMAILGNAKRFIRSPSAQKVIGMCYFAGNREQGPALNDIKR